MGSTQAVFESFVGVFPSGKGWTDAYDFIAKAFEDESAVFVT